MWALTEEVVLRRGLELQGDQLTGEKGWEELEVVKFKETVKCGNNTGLSYYVN